MAQTISLPSKLRREIVSLIRLNPKMEQRSLGGELEDKIVHTIFEIVDIACSFLQGAKPSDETNARFDAVLDETEKINDFPGLQHHQQQTILNIERHLQDIRNICQDPSLPDELQNERVPVPSYSQLTETVFLANGQLMAESFRLFLESFGIQAILGRESAGVVYGLTVGPLGEVDVNVTPENAADARILLDAMKKGYFMLEDELEQTDEDLSSEDDPDEWSEEDSTDDALDEDEPQD